MKLEFECQNYETSARDLLGRLEAEKVAFFMEDRSGEGRFRFLAYGVHQYEELEVGRAQTTLKELVEELDQQEIAGCPELKKLPFTGGLIGLINFEFGYETHRISQRKDTVGLGEVAFFKNVIVTDFKDKKTYFIRINLPEVDAKSRYSAISGSSSSTRFDRQLFRMGFARIKEKIRVGELFQCVFSLSRTYRSPLSPINVFSRLRQESSSPYTFIFKSIERTVLAASPEKLVSMDANGFIETHPIAGTRPRGENEINDKKFEKSLKASVKERAEHLMLVDLARNDLGKVCLPGTINVNPFMHVKKFKSVMHLVSEVSGLRENGCTADQVLNACFPAGTLSGAPKKRALQFIRDNENQDRGAYGGSLFTYDVLKRLDSAICIRGIEHRGVEFKIQAGAGIVHDSRFDCELEEIKKKSSVACDSIGGL